MRTAKEIRQEITDTRRGAGAMTWKFFSHFNRINMQRGNPKVWTVHFRGTCYQAEGIVYKVHTFTTFDPKGRQPRAKVCGRAREVKQQGKQLVVE